MKEAAISKPLIFRLLMSVKEGGNTHGQPPGVFKPTA